MGGGASVVLLRPPGARQGLGGERVCSGALCMWVASGELCALSPLPLRARVHAQTPMQAELRTSGFKEVVTVESDHRHRVVMGIRPQE